MSKMQAVEIQGSGDSATLALCERPMPEIKPHEVLIKTAYAGLNRADIFQRQGSYAPPDGASDIPGLEVSGTIEAVGADVTSWSIGDEVCALLSGGGYAQYVTVPAIHCLPIPSNLGLKEAAGLPECVVTVWMTLMDDARLQPNESVLIHGGSSGIGTTAIQFAIAYGCQNIFNTAGSTEKCSACSDLGAQAINYREQDFVEVVKSAGGVDVVLDMVGGEYINRNLKVLKTDGRLISIAFLQGAKMDVSAGGLLMKRLSWKGSALRARSDEQKGEYISQIRQTVWPWVESGQISPLIDSVFPMDQAMQAQERMEKSLHIGKILLQIHA